MKITMLPHTLMVGSLGVETRLTLRRLARYLIRAALVGAVAAFGYFLYWFGVGNHLFAVPGASSNASPAAQINKAKMATPTAGPLTIHPANPRYFADRTGKAVYLVGSHTWSNLQDTGGSDPPAAFDYNQYLDFLETNNLNFFRLWAWEQAKWGPWLTGDIYFAPLPYERTGPGTALDGKPKFDLTKFNQPYFDRLRQRVMQAGARGIYVSIMLFDGWSIEDKGLGMGNPWLGHPFHRQNNINGVDGDPNQDNQGHEVHTLQVQAVIELQEAYVRKVIDTVADLDNVLFEISNESHGDSDAWQVHLINFIKSYEANKQYQHPVGMTVEWPNGDNGQLFASPADWISPNNYFDPPPADGSKVIIADTDHIWGIGGDRQWAWKSLMRGVNPIFMDPYDCSPVWPPDNCNTNNPEWVSLRANLGYTRAYADRINLAAIRPRGDLASSGYCLANPAATGAEYLVYLPAGSTVTAVLSGVGVDRQSSIYLPTDSSVTVDLSATTGDLLVEWFNPETGATVAGGTTTGGAIRSFTAPFGGDAVLYLYQEQGTPPPTYQLFVPIVGDGTVSVSPPGPYAEGQAVTLSAIPAAGWSFSGWSGDFSGLDNPLMITIAANTTITATFAETGEPITYTVAVGVEGEGVVVVTPKGPYPTGTVITVTAIPTPTWVFTGWSGDLVGTANPLTFTISADTTITATFVKEEQPTPYSLTIGIVGQGAAIVAPEGPYPAGTVITITAIATPTWAFIGWRGDLIRAANPLTFTIHANTLVTATFALESSRQYTLTRNVIGEGEIELSSPGPFASDEVITMTANPAPDWRFMGWSGDVVSTTNPISVLIAGNSVITATFVPITPTEPLTITVQLFGQGEVELSSAGPYTVGQSITLTALPAPDWHFAGWSGDILSQTNPLHVTITKTLSILASFYRYSTHLPVIQPTAGEPEAAQ